MSAANGEEVMPSTFLTAERLLDKSILKLMGEACKVEDVAFAYDLAQRLHVEKVRLQLHIIYFIVFS